MAYVSNFASDPMELIRRLYEAMGRGPGPRTRERLSDMGVPPGGNYAPDRTPATAPRIMSNAEYPEGFPVVADEVRPSWWSKLWDKMHGAQMVAEPFMQAAAARGIMGPPGQGGAMTPDAAKRQREKLIEEIRAGMFGLEGDIEAAQAKRPSVSTPAESSEINAPGNSNWIKWSKMSDPEKPEPDSFDTRNPADILRALAGGGGRMTAQDIMTGNRPSDIMAREMYAKDKEMAYIKELLMSQNPQARERGVQMLQGMGAVREYEDQPRLQEIQQALEEQKITEKTKQEQLKAAGDITSAQMDAAARLDAAKIDQTLGVLEVIMSALPEGTDDMQRLSIALGFLKNMLGVDPAAMGISLEQ